jgi:hypothetical protein
MDQPRPFKRLLVENHFHLASQRQILIYWVMNEAFTAEGPYTFTLQRGRAANDDSWVDVATVVDRPWLYDNNVVLRAFDGSTFYRVKLVDAKQVVHFSQPVPITTVWDHADWRRMKEITRKEVLVRRLAGTRGWLLKRRQFGATCDCVDPNNNQIRDSHCVECYGTGIIGGYYSALEFNQMKKPEQRMKRLTGDQGLVTTVLNTGDFLAWPQPEANDIWVNAYANKRFRIEGDVTVTADWRGVPLLMNLRLTELPTTDVIYEFPTPVPERINVSHG